MAYVSATEQAILKVNLGRVLADSKLIKGIINRDRGTIEKKRMVEGAKYYEGEHDVLKKDFRVYYVRGQQKISPTKANNKTINTFHTDLVDQKKDYILSVPPTITHKQEEVQNIFKNLLSEKLYDFLEHSCINASNKGIEWGHVFIDEKGEFNYSVIPAEQIIPDYDNSYSEKLLSVMRYYNVDSEDEKGNLKQRLKVEIWDEKEVRFFIETEKGDFILDLSEKENPRPHWKELTVLGESIVKANNMSWGRVPFFPLPNNHKKISDLKRIKTLIDLYDIILSGFGNQIEDLKEIMVVIKNYDGTDNEEMIRLFKENNFIKVSGEGGAESLELTIPVAAKESILKMLEKNIYRFGRGFNLNDENFAGNISGIALKYKYAALDLKANAMIKNLGKYVKELLSYYGQFNDVEIKPEDLEVTFSKSMIINETELIANIANSSGIISKRTQMQIHPFVKNVDEEIKQLEEENSGMVDLLTDGNV